MCQALKSDQSEGMTEHMDQGQGADDSGATTTQFAPPAQARMRPPLRRLRTDKVLGGVASGFARWIGIDPVIVRVVLVVLAIFGGSGLLLYVIGWLFIPMEGHSQSEAEQFVARHRNDESGSKLPPWLIVAAVIVGVIVLGGIFSAGPWGGWWSTGGWLLLLTAGGVAIWLYNRDGDKPAQAPSSTAYVMPSVQETPVEPEAMGFAHGGAGDYPSYVAPPVSTEPPPAPPKPKSYLGAATLSLAVIVVGLLSALSLGDVYTIEPVAIMAAGLGVLGLGLLVGTLFGRALWLLSLAIPLAVVTLIASVVPSTLAWGDGIGERVWRPTTVAEASAPHRLSIGDATLDLTQLQIPRDSSVPVDVYLGIGQLKVILPTDLHVNVDARVGFGELEIAGQPRIDGKDNSARLSLPPSNALQAGGATPEPTITLVATLSIGSMEVSRA